MDPLQVHKNRKIFLLLDPEIGAVGHIASMAILPAGALLLFCLVCSREIVTTPAGFKTKGAKIVFCGISQTNKAEVDHNKI